MARFLALAVLLFSMTAQALDLGSEDVALIRPEGGRKNLILPKPIDLEIGSRKKVEQPGTNCMDPTGRATTSGGPFSDTCTGTTARY